MCVFYSSQLAVFPFFISLAHATDTPMNFCPCRQLLFPSTCPLGFLSSSLPGSQCLKHDVELQLESRRRAAMAAPHRGSLRGTPRGQGRPTPAGGGVSRTHVRAPHAGARSGVFTPLTPHPGQARPRSRRPGPQLSARHSPRCSRRRVRAGGGGAVRSAAAVGRRMRGASPVSGSSERGAGAGGACVWASRRRV